MRRSVNLFFQVNGILTENLRSAYNKRPTGALLNRLYCSVYYVYLYSASSEYSMNTLYCLQYTALLYTLNALFVNIIMFPRSTLQNKSCA